MAVKRNLMAPSKANEEVTVNVRKIDNGFIIRRSSYDDKGNYKSSEHFSATAPQIPVPAAPSKPAPAKPAPKPAPRATGGKKP